MASKVNLTKAREGMYEFLSDLVIAPLEEFADVARGEGDIPRAAFLEKAVSRLRAGLLKHRTASVPDYANDLFVKRGNNSDTTTKVETVAPDYNSTGLENGSLAGSPIRNDPTVGERYWDGLRKAAEHNPMNPDKRKTVDPGSYDRTGLE